MSEPLILIMDLEYLEIDYFYPRIKSYILSIRKNWDCLSILDFDIRFSYPWASIYWEYNKVCLWSYGILIKSWATDSFGKKLDILIWRLDINFDSKKRMVLIWI